MNVKEVDGRGVKIATGVKTRFQFCSIPKLVSTLKAHYTTRSNKKDDLNEMLRAQYSIY